MGTIALEISSINNAKSDLADALIATFGMPKTNFYNAVGTANEEIKRLANWSLTDAQITLANALVFTKDGLGDDDTPNTQFDGSTVKTISYNTIGALEAGYRDIVDEALSILSSEISSLNTKDHFDELTTNHLNSNSASIGILQVEELHGNLPGGPYLPLEGGTMSGRIILSKNESNEISLVYNNNGVLSTQLGSLASIRNALDFKWYNSHYLIGNIRGSGENSIGFGITEGNNNCVFRVNSSGAWVNNNTVLHSGNSSISGNTITINGTSTTWTRDGGDADTVDGYHASDFVRAFGTYNSNYSIDSDWGQSFVTFDPIPSGIPPILNPNISVINIGNNFIRRKQLAIPFDQNRMFLRRYTGSWSNWREFAFLDSTVDNAKYAHNLSTNSEIVFGKRDSLQYFNASLSTTSGATNNATPYAGWFHIIRMNHSNTNGYYVDIATSFHDNNMYFRRIVNGSDKGWCRIATYEDISPILASVESLSTKDYFETLSTNHLNSNSISVGILQVDSPINGTINYASSSGNSDTVDNIHGSNLMYSWGSEDFNPSTYDGYYSGMTTQSGITNDWWHILSMNWGTTRLVGTKIWASQLALPTVNRRSLYYRTGTNDTSYSSWIKVLDLENYTDYTVTKTGTGAFGNWEINITGIAAKAINTYVLSSESLSTVYLVGTLNTTNTYKLLYSSSNTDSRKIYMNTSTGYLYATKFSGVATTATNLESKPVINWVDSAGSTETTKSKISITIGDKTSDAVLIGKVNQAYSADSAGKVSISTSFVSNTRYLLFTSGTTGSLSVYTNTGIYVTPSTKSLYASAFYETSDYDLKENISKISDLHKAKNIEFIEFNFKDSPTKKYGVIAQQLLEIGLDNLVSGEDFLAVDYISMLCLKIAQLEDEIKKLKLIQNGIR